MWRAVPASTIDFMKAGIIAIVGRPSAGKSTLMNEVCGEKISIVSPHPQTTRRAVRGILNEERGQIVFIDTPGYHTSEKKLNRYLSGVAENSLKEGDAVLYLIDSTRKPGDEETRICGLVKPLRDRVVVGVTKIDDPRSNRDSCAAFIADMLGPVRTHPVSAVTKEGVDGLLDSLFSLLPESPPLYPEDLYTDQEPEFRLGEIIREKAISHTREELPHALFVEVADLEFRREGKELWARVFLVTERESQKGILIGKGGSLIKKIRIDSEKECREIFPYHVRIDLRVKVDPKWKSRDALLKRMTKG